MGCWGTNNLEISFPICCIFNMVGVRVCVVRKRIGDGKS